jgi:FAD/FMN-containing dehydrogenase
MQRRAFVQSALTAAMAGALPASVLAEVTRSLAQVSDSLQAVSGSGRQLSIPRSAVQDLAASLRGPLLLPGQEGYELARRVLNPAIDKHPALVVQPTSAADVMRAVDFARDNDLLVAVKCGGHSYGGKSTCDGGLQIDLSRLRHARVELARRRAHIGGGSLLGELDHEAMAHGLVTTAGTVSHTGVGGLTLGGGFGRLARRFGLALDNLASVDVVTADGRLRHTSETENPDLFWGLRGGGGNFGVATNFEFKLHPMQRRVVGGDLIFPLTQLRQLLRFYADYSQRAPDELYLDLVITSRLGSDEGVVLLHTCWSGEESTAAAALAPLYQAGTPLKDSIVAQDYVALQRSLDNTDPRNTNEYLKSGFVNDIPAGLIDAIEQHFKAVPERGTTLLFQHAGGAVARVPGDATAFAQRQAIANMLWFVSWPLSDSPTEHIAYVRESWKALEPYTDGWYSNEVHNETAAVVNANYQGNYPRLMELKKRYDPGNLFRLNANITPSA